MTFWNPNEFELVKHLEERIWPEDSGKKAIRRRIVVCISRSASRRKRRSASPPASQPPPASGVGTEAGSVPDLRRGKAASGQSSAGRQTLLPSGWGVSEPRGETGTQTWLVVLRAITSASTSDMPILCSGCHFKHALATSQKDPTGKLARLGCHDCADLTKACHAGSST